MATKTVKHRGYEIVISSPDNDGSRWRVVISPPDKSEPLTMPTFATEESATEEAMATVNEVLGGPAKSGA